MTSGKDAPAPAAPATARRAHRRLLPAPPHGALLGLALLGLSLLPACENGRPLTPAWQQDPTLYHHGVPDRAAHTSTTPHAVSRIYYGAPGHVQHLVARQGDVADAQRGPARMADGTLELALQDAATGKWLEADLCGGHLFVSGLPNQAYRIVVKNRSPMPLQLGVGVDGRDLETGAPASLRRGSLRVPARGSLVLDHTAQGGPLLFRTVRDDMVLHDLGPRGRPGLIQVATYLSSDAPSVGPEKMRPDQVLPLSLFPIRAPEQYR